MKKLLYLLLLPILLSNCSKTQESLLDMPYLVNFTIPAGLSAFENWYFPIENIPNNKAALFAAAGMSDDEVTAIRGKSALLSALFSTEEFDFIFDISVRVYKDNPDDYRELFYRAEVPLNTPDELNLIGGDSDVQDYLNENTFNIVVRIIPRETITTVLDAQLEFVLSVQ